MIKFVFEKVQPNGGKVCIFLLSDDGLEINLIDDKFLLSA